ncbi:MAG: TlpA disulfide reductase family protein [Candidatus Acidiferrum sp.]
MDKNEATRADGWVEDRLERLNPSDEWQPNVTVALARFRNAQASGSFIRTRWVHAAAAVAAACLCVMLLPSPQVLAHRCLECSIAVWESLAASGPQQTKVKPESERQVAPDFELQDVSGKEVKLSDLKGKVVLVNFWATWCEGCQVEIPWFVEFAKKYEDKGLVVIGVSLDGDGWKSVRPWLKGKKVNYTIVIGNEGLGKKYGLEGMPLTALVGRDGKVADTHAGIVDKEATEGKIRALLLESEKAAPN